MISKQLHFSIILLSMLSALLLFLSLPNFIVLQGIPAISFISITPFLIALFLCPSLRYALKITVFWIILFVSGIFFWILNFQELALLAYLGLVLGWVLYFSNVLASIKCIINNYSASYRPFLIAIFWVGYEFIRSRGYLAFPWALLSQGSHHFTSFIQIANIGGEWLLSFLVIYTNAVLFELFVYFTRNNTFITHSLYKNVLLSSQPKIHHTIDTYHNTKHPIVFHTLFLCLLYVLTFSYGIYSLQKKPIENTNTLTTLAVQQNVDSWNTDQKIDTLHNIIQTSQDALDTLTVKPDIMFWSETSLFYLYQPKELPNTRYFYESNPPEYPFLHFLQNNQIPLVSGIPIQKTIDNNTVYYNSTVIINPQGNIIDSYFKNQLVPIAEYVPYSRSFIMSNLLKLIGLSSFWEPGKSVKPVTVPLVKNTGELYSINLGVIICFEDAFSFITRTHANLNADLLVNISNVSWSKTKSAQMQQIIASKFRSIETGLPMLRITNSGITALIDPWGRITQEVPMFTTATMLSKIPLISIDTYYRYFGDTVGVLCTLGLIIISVLCFIRYTKYAKEANL